MEDGTLWTVPCGLYQESHWGRGSSRPSVCSQGLEEAALLLTGWA